VLLRSYFLGRGVLGCPISNLSGLCSWMSESSVPVICDRCGAAGLAGQADFSHLGDLLEFDPVPRQLKRQDGWTPERPIRDDLGAMALIVSLRNKLAHGSLSFAECGQNDTPDELSVLADGIANYLRAVVAAFVRYLEEHQYLRPERRPESAPAAA
jgi:hypothetical protein